MPFLRRVVERHHEAAAAKKLRTVPCCGFDSAPFDLGALLVRRCMTAVSPHGKPTHCSQRHPGQPSHGATSRLQVVDHMRKRHGKRPARVLNAVTEQQGGVSGGTIASLMNLAQEARRDPAAAGAWG